MESIIRPIKELMMIGFIAILYGGIFLSFIRLFMEVSY